MVYDSDFYTTRRPYRASPAYSSYTTSFEPSRQVRILPGLGKVHIVHSYDRLVPYVGHKRLTVVTSTPSFATRPSRLQREYDWIERRVRPHVGYSATNRYLNSDSAVRIYYSGYPISSSYYSTLSLPSSTYYPKVYRWYYSWPRTYSSNYTPSYYWPYYRSYLGSWFRNYNLSYLPSLYDRSLDYEFSGLENKVDNLSVSIKKEAVLRLKMLTYLRNPISQGYEWSWYPDARFYYHWKIYRPLSFNLDWPLTARERFPQYWPSRSSYGYYLNDFPSEAAFREIRRMIYLNYPYKTLDYYPDSTRIYKPLTCYYNYYYPVRSLNYYSDVWPYYPYYRYLYYKYTLPSDRYYHLKGRIVYLPYSPSATYRVYPSASYVRNKIYKPLGLYADYYDPIRSLFWNSSYWPLYRTVGSFNEELPSKIGGRLQKIFDNETSLIRAQSSALLRRIHDPVPRVQRLSWPLSTVSRHYDNVLPSRYSTDSYIHKIAVSSPFNEKVSYTTYHTEPVRKYIGSGRLASITYAGGKAYNRRPHIYLYDNPMQNDIQLLSFYINKFKQEKAYNVDTSKSESKKIEVDDKPVIEEVTDSQPASE